MEIKHENTVMARYTFPKRKTFCKKTVTSVPLPSGRLLHPTAASLLKNKSDLKEQHVIRLLKTTLDSELVTIQSFLIF